MKQIAVMAVLTITLMIIANGEIEAKKCKKNDPSEKDKKCLKSKKSRKEEKKPSAPHWRKGPPKSQEKVGREGKRATFTCAVKGNPRPEFTWLRNGKKLNQKTSKKIRIRRHRLTIKNLLIQDTGTYTCIANNSLGSLQFTYSLRILENIGFKSIDVVKHPENQTVQAGDTAMFQCRSKDFPEPKVHWTRQVKGSALIETLPESSSHPDGGDLLLHNVTKNDSGLYTCYIGNNKIHKKLSASLTVIEEGESLPFEPPCALHARMQVFVDHEHGCKSRAPVNMRYCMGSCGRSYHIPLMLTEDSNNTPYQNRTCNCCVGIIKSLRFIELDCSLGQKKMGFFPLFGACKCQPCAMKKENQSSTPTLTTMPPA